MGLFKKDYSDWLEAKATVVSEHDHELELSVSLPGETAYTVTAKQDIPDGWAGTLQGRTVPCRVNPEKHDKVHIEWGDAPGGRPADLDKLAQALGGLAQGAAGHVQVVDGGTQVIDASNIPGLKDDLLAALGQHGIHVEQAAMQAEDPLDRLEKLAKLHTSGVLTDAEFAAQKKKLLGET